MSAQIHLNDKLPKIDSLKSLIDALMIVFSEDNVNVELVKSLMRSYKSNRQEWKQYAKFDKFRYTRNLVHEGNGKYNLMLVCWNEGQGSSIHDHSDAHCFMKVLHGDLVESRFDWPKQGCEDQPLRMTGNTSLPTEEVCYINDSLGLHRVENPSSSDVAVSLHLYIPPYNECQVFNQQTGQKSRCKVTFWSKYGKKPDRKTQEERPPEDN